MWQSYFYQIQKKYNMRLSYKNPLVIRLDGKNITKNKSYDLLNNYENSFRNTLEKAVQYFTEKYHCYSIFGSDEVSFIFINPMILIQDLDKEKYSSSNEIISLFTQYFFDYFNNFNKHTKVFWHGKCFSIKKEKLKSYIKFRSRVIRNVMTTYFLITKGVRVGNANMETKDNECKKFNDYNILQDTQDGVLYFDGNRIDLQEFYNDNIKIVDESNDDMFSDLF